MMHSAPDRRLSTITTNQRGLSGNASGPVQSFVTLGSITDMTQIGALNTLYNDLVSTNISGTSLWDKIQVLYPFVGGTATAHALNLKDATQYPITFTGSIVHSANGVSGTASLNASFSSTYNMTSLSANDFSFGMYMRSPMAGLSTQNLRPFDTSTSSTYLNFRGDQFIASQTKLASGGTISSGLYGESVAKFMAITSDSPTTAFSFQNQFQVTTSIAKASTLTGTIGASLSSTTAGAVAHTMSIWYVATAMTETELIALNAIFQKYNTTLDTAFSSTRGTDYYINPSYDRNVNRFISNIQVPGIATFTTTELNALQYLVTALQNSSTNLWGNLTQIYPFIGSNLSGRLRELKTLGTSSATSSGTFNFTTQIGLDATSAASYVTPAAPLATTAWSSVILYGVYVSEDFTSTGYEIGYGTTAAAATRFSLNVRNASNNAVVTIGALTAVTASNTNAIGHYTLVSGGSGAAVTLYKNGSSVGSGTAGTTGTTGALNMFGGQSGSTASQRIQGVSYFFLGTWTTAQASEMNTIVQNYVSMLGR